MDLNQIKIATKHRVIYKGIITCPQNVIKESDESTQKLYEVKIGLEHLITMWAKYKDIQQSLELHEENKAHFQDRIQAEEQGLKQKSYWNKSIRDQLYLQYQDNKRRHSTLLRLQVVKTIEIKQPQTFCFHHSSV
jgi:hypothetical protein